MQGLGWGGCRRSRLYLQCLESNKRAFRTCTRKFHEFQNKQMRLHYTADKCEVKPFSKVFFTIWKVQGQKYLWQKLMHAYLQNAHVRVLSPLWGMSLLNNICWGVQVCFAVSLCSYGSLVIAMTTKTSRQPSNISDDRRCVGEYQPLPACQFIILLHFPPKQSSLHIKVARDIKCGRLISAGTCVLCRKTSHVSRGPGSLRLWRSLCKVTCTALGVCVEGSGQLVLVSFTWTRRLKREKHSFLRLRFVPYWFSNAGPPGVSWKRKTCADTIYLIFAVLIALIFFLIWL